MKKIILAMLTLLALTGCLACDARVKEDIAQDAAWDCKIMSKHIELENLIFENIEIETYDTNTVYWENWD